MNKEMINDSIFSIDRLFLQNYFLFDIKVNDYQIVAFIWNIFLLLIPFFIVIILSRLYQKKKKDYAINRILVLLLGIIWLLFIPNSAYIMTDVRHLVTKCMTFNYFNVCVQDAWFIIVFFAYGLIGWLSLVFLVGQMKFFMNEIGKLKIAKLFPWLLMPFISLGMLLGLVQRWNSWEIFSDPSKLLLDACIYFCDKECFINWSVYTVFLYILYFAGDWLLSDKFKKIYGLFENRKS